MVKNEIEKCVVCGKEIPDGVGRFNYPVGTHCNECGEKSKWHEKFSKMRASQIIKYMGIDPAKYGLDQDTLNYLSNDNKNGDE